MVRLDEDDALDAGSYQMPGTVVAGERGAVERASPDRHAALRCIEDGAHLSVYGPPELGDVLESPFEELVRQAFGERRPKLSPFVGVLHSAAHEDALEVRLQPLGDPCRDRLLVRAVGVDLGDLELAVADSVFFPMRAAAVCRYLVGSNGDDRPVVDDCGADLPPKFCRASCCTGRHELAVLIASRRPIPGHRR